MTPLPTPAELREVLRNPDWAKAQVYLRQFASLIEDANKGVTDEVVKIALRALWPNDELHSFRYREEWMHDMRSALLSIAPHLALTKDKP